MQVTETSVSLHSDFYTSIEEELILNVNKSLLLNNSFDVRIVSTLPVPPHDLTDWGPKRDPLYIVIPITVLYIIIFVTGLLGNICTCIVISRNKSMHTATNYYLFSLAVSDLLLLISGLPTEIYSTWYKYPYIFGEVFCILQGLAAETSANATVLTITAFTIERYVAICHPFLSHTMSKLSRAFKFVIVIWLLAMCLALPQAMTFGIYYEQNVDDHPASNDHYVCIVKREVIPHAFEISTFVFFVAPMSVITILYILIGLQIRKSALGRSRDGGSVRLKHRTQTKAFSHNNNRSATSLNENKTEAIQLTYEEAGRKNFPRNSQATKHVVKMLVAVVVAFFICWAPFHAQRLLAIYGQPDSPNMVTTFAVLTYVSGVLYYLSTTINPLLYHIMSHKFRVAFKDTIVRFLRRKSVPVGERCYFALSRRSSQVNSQSNTDSCSQQSSSLRYLETEMRRLRDSRRPLVVSFKRKQPQIQKIKQVTILDVELQKALDNLTEESRQSYNREGRMLKKSRSCVRKCHHNSHQQHGKITCDNLNLDYRFIQSPNLESSFAFSTNNDTLKVSWQDACSDDHMKINTKRNLKLNSSKEIYNPRDFDKCLNDLESSQSKGITKSCTLPNINNDLNLYA